MVKFDVSYILANFQGKKNKTLTGKQKVMNCVDKKIKYI